MFKNLVDLPFFFQTKYILFANRIPPILSLPFQTRLIKEENKKI